MKGYVLVASAVVFVVFLVLVQEPADLQLEVELAPAERRGRLLMRNNGTRAVHVYHVCFRWHGGGDALCAGPELSGGVGGANAPLLFADRTLGGFVLRPGQVATLMSFRENQDYVRTWLDDTQLPATASDSALLFLQVMDKVHMRAQVCYSTLPITGSLPWEGLVKQWSPLTDLRNIRLVTRER